MDSGDSLVSRTRFRSRWVCRSRRMRLVGKAIYFSGSEEPFLPPEGTDGADVFQRERESKAAFNAEAKIHLTHFEAQAKAVHIIAKLCCRPLENRMLSIV